MSDEPPGGNWNLGDNTLKAILEVCKVLTLIASTIAAIYAANRAGRAETHSEQAAVQSVENGERVKKVQADVRRTHVQMGMVPSSDTE